MQTSSANLARWLVGVGLGALVLLLLYALRGVLTPVFFAFLLAYMLDPAVDRCEAWGAPRPVGVFAILFVVLTVLGLSVLLLLPALVQDLAALARELPAALSRLLSAVEPWLGERGIALPASGPEALARIQGDLRELAPSAAGPVQAAVRSVLGGTASAVSTALGLLIVPMVAFYLLQDFDRITAYARELLPVRTKPAVLEIVGEIDHTLGQFARGQLMVMACLSLLYAVGYALIGIRLAIPIGIVAGLLSFIPYVGGGIALGMALLMAALHYQGVGQLVMVGVVYGVVQVLESFVITPRIVGDKLGLSPLWVLIALMAGGELFGFLGVMLALPAAAVVKVFVLRGLSSYRQSAFFNATQASDLAVASAAAPLAGTHTRAQCLSADRAAVGVEAAPRRSGSRLRLRPRRGTRRRGSGR